MTINSDAGSSKDDHDLIAEMLKATRLGRDYQRVIVIYSDNTRSAFDLPKNEPQEPEESKLSPMKEAVVEVVERMGAESLSGLEIAQRSGFKLSGKMSTFLAGLVRLNVLKKTTNGYAKVKK